MSTDLPEQSEADDAVFSDEDGVLYDEDVTPEYGILGFTVRELLIVGVWLVSFVISFIPLNGGLSLWGIGIQWILPVGLPTAAVFLLVLRRFSPDGIRRVGSLGIDQFASVAFSVSAVIWVGTLWLTISALVDAGYWGLPWNGVVLLIASLALVALTIFAPIIPGLREDFHGRLVTLAHRNANPVRPVIARPRPEAAPDTEGSATAPEGHESAPSGNGSTPEGYASASGDYASTSEGYAPAPEGSPSSAEGHSVGTPADHTETSVFTPMTDLDPELSGDHATDEVARLDVAEQVPLAAHASGGDTGTTPVTADEEYVPSYSRRSRGQEPEIVSDTGSIESLLGTAARIEGEESSGDERGYSAADDVDGADLEATNPRDSASVAQPFWILAPSERDVHDERGEPLFRIGPSAWALVIEDRGGAYVIRHDDGRIGYLHEMSDITRG